jgi:hypothetical protein
MAVVIAVATLGTMMAMSGSKPSTLSHPSGGGTSASTAKTGQPPAGAAAAWVSAQVSPATIVSCDQAMCTALEAHGYPARNLRPLSSASTLKASGVVVATPAAQQLFGSSLVTAWAPGVLARFGSGASAISVRIVAPNGAAAYEQGARHDQAARVASETALTQSSSIAASRSAALDLKSGRVDGRLAEAIAEAATAEPIDILDFGNAGTGASAEVPLRYADLAASNSATDMSASEYVQTLQGGMNGSQGVRPDRAQLLTLAGGHQVLRVEFLAPSPFGVLNSP